MRYLRFQAASPNGRGVHVGIFALANGLARDGVLDETDHAWWAASNAWYDAAYPDPAASDPTLFDRSCHPVVTCWFKASATHLLDKVPGYLALLDRYGMAWQRVNTKGFAGWWTWSGSDVGQVGVAEEATDQGR